MSAPVLVFSSERTSEDRERLHQKLVSDFRRAARRLAHFSGTSALEVYEAAVFAESRAEQRAADTGLYVEEVPW